MLIYAWAGDTANGRISDSRIQIDVNVCIANLCECMFDLGSMRGRKPWKKDYRRRGGKSWTPAPKPYIQHSHDGLPMHAHPTRFPQPHPFAPVKPWWARFGRPVTYLEDDEEDHSEEFMERFMQTTTYPPDYPKWESIQVCKLGAWPYVALCLRDFFLL
jgi:hypothetical protein